MLILIYLQWADICKPVFQSGIIPLSRQGVFRLGPNVMVVTYLYVLIHFLFPIQDESTSGGSIRVTSEVSRVCVSG